MREADCCALVTLHHHRQHDLRTTANRLHAHGHITHEQIEKLSPPFENTVTRPSVLQQPSCHAPVTTKAKGTSETSETSEHVPHPARSLFTLKRPLRTPRTLLHLRDGAKMLLRCTGREKAQTCFMRATVCLFGGHARGGLSLTACYWSEGCVRKQVTLLPCL